MEITMHSKWPEMSTHSTKGSTKGTKKSPPQLLNCHIRRKMTVTDQVIRLYNIEGGYKT